MVHSITYDCLKKDADKKGLSFFRFPKDHKLRLTWFKKLRLVDPPNTDNIRVCSEHFTEECFIIDVQAAMGFKKTKKRSLTKDAAPTLFSFTKLAVPRVLSEKRAKVWAAVFTFNPYLLISINELMISIIHLLISINELLISIN